MKNINIIILGVNADIGLNVCKYYLNSGASIIGTYRKKKPDIDISLYKKNILNNLRKILI